MDWAAEVSHDSTGWLNDVALTNIDFMVVTAEVSHEFTAWLNDVAL